MSLSVTTLFFASYRDLVGTERLAVEVGEGETVSDLVARLQGRGEGFASLPDRPAVAVNRRYADLSEPLSAGDEVAFIPPVAGG